MRLRGINRRALLIGVGLVLGAVVFRDENFLERLFIDLRFFIVANSRVQEAVSDSIAVVLMDSASEQKMGVTYGTKWRQFHADLIRKLNDAHARIIVFDSMFYDQDPSRDPQFAAAVEKAGNVLAGEDGTMPTDKNLRAAFLAIGDLKIPPLGGEARFIQNPIADPVKMKPLAVLAVQQFVERSGGPLALGAASRSTRIWINYRQPPVYFPAFSYADVLEAQQGRVRDVLSGSLTPMSVFSGRMVFIGRDEGEPSPSDRFPFPNTLGRRYAGVYGHAYAADTILLDRPVIRASPWIDAACTFMLLVILVLLLEVHSRKIKAATLILLPIAAFILSLALLSSFNIWISFAPPFVGFWTVLILHWALLRISLASSLSRAVGFDPRLIEAFRSERERKEGPVRKEVTILIADVRDYTRYVSNTDPSMVSNVMSEYMQAMDVCITAQGGYINKFVGDEIVAAFGFPLASALGTQRAVRAAIAMLDELSRLVTAWKTRNLVSIERMGIGIDAGTVSFAEIGGRTRSQFDIIGNCINGASRIEHLTKEFKRSLLVSEEVWRSIENEDSLAGMFELVKTVAVRGQGERRIFGIVR